MSTGFKELIQKMQMVDGGFFEGTVIRASPLTISLANVDNYEVTESMLTVPEHLTNHEVDATVTGLLVTTSEGSGTASGNCKITLKQALAVGDTVALFGYNDRKSYVVVGRL